MNDYLQKEVCEVAKSSRENLECALALIDAANDFKSNITRPVVTELLDRLRALAKQLGNEWELEYQWEHKAITWESKPVTPNLPIILRKRHWPFHSGIAICLEGNGRIAFGFRSPTSKAYNKGHEKKYPKISGQSHWDLVSEREQMHDFF